MKRVAFIAAGLAATGLAACAGPSNGNYSAYSSSPSGNAAPSSNIPPRQARLTSPTAKPTLDTLPGMSGNDLNKWLGAPQFRRRDGQAEIWQYRGSACTLDVFLYTEGSDLRVRYVEARNHSDTANAPSDTGQARTCASSLINSRVNAASPG